jgi:hypothetical protein
MNEKLIMNRLERLEKTTSNMSPASTCIACGKKDFIRNLWMMDIRMFYEDAKMDWRRETVDIHPECAPFKRIVKPGKKNPPERD